MNSDSTVPYLDSASKDQPFQAFGPWEQAHESLGRP